MGFGLDTVNFTKIQIIVHCKKITKMKILNISVTVEEEKNLKKNNVFEKYNKVEKTVWDWSEEKKTYFLSP